MCRSGAAEGSDDEDSIAGLVSTLLVVVVDTESGTEYAPLITLKDAGRVVTDRQKAITKEATVMKDVVSYVNDMGGMGEIDAFLAPAECAEDDVDEDGVESEEESGSGEESEEESVEAEEDDEGQSEEESGEEAEVSTAMHPSLAALV